MFDRNPMTPIKRTSLIVYDTDIFNCSQQTADRLCGAEYRYRRDSGAERNAGVT